MNFNSNTIGKVYELRTLPEKESGKKPCARSGHRCVADKTRLYVFGGYNPNIETLKRYYDDFNAEDIETIIPLFDELWEFNFATSRWKKMSTSGPMPTELASMAMILVGSTVIVYGGTGYPFGITSSNKIYTLSTKSLEWRCHEPEEYSPVPTYGCAISVNEGNVYTYGGTTGWSYISNVDRYNMQSGEWTSMYDSSTDWLHHFSDPHDHVTSPRPRYRHEMLSDQNNLYVLGGGTSGEAYELDIIYIFNLQTKTWKKHQSKNDEVHGYPANRRCFGCCQLKDHAYISGGLNERKMHDDIWRLSLQDCQWTKCSAKLLFPLYFHASAVTPAGCMYIHGGVKTLTGDKRSLKLSRIWLVVPNLLELCWSKVLHLIPKIQRMSVPQLWQLGIPQELIERLDYEDH
ncbi:kelch domain-containing protein 10-like [Antedon mediterranea]|uniref:kelch domain-containing protein 10-like n=1 Tax=Antedon mediterranea TaxID=105859 RepID=UPI003AF9E82E